MLIKKTMEKEANKQHQKLPQVVQKGICNGYLE